ncbi:prephenate dehydrogenase [Halobacteriales archaeon QS_8_65_32]|nr:MAG: prephenate dehydrogenase [Halobacteriales archaeon QS_8_65_32]
MLVVGAGPVGRWIAGVLDAGETAFCDVDRVVANRAAEGLGGRVLDADSGERFDVVGFAVPIPAIEEAIAAHASRAREGVFDSTGVMADPIAAMAAHASDVDRVSLHPLFAPKRAPGRVAMVAGSGSDDGHTTGDGETGSGVGRDADSLAAGVEGALRAVGNEVFYTTAADHDEAMKTVQARAHAAVLAFALAAEPVDERFHTPVSGTLAEIATKVTDGNPETYAEIQAAFEGATDVVAAADRIANADPETFQSLYREAGANGGGEEGRSDDGHGGREGTVGSDRSDRNGGHDGDGEDG